MPESINGIVSADPWLGFADKKKSGGALEPPRVPPFFPFHDHPRIFPPADPYPIPG